MRDALPRFEGLDAVVLGVSPDSVEAHAKFARKYDLPYPLLADTEHSVAEAYGVWQEKSLFGHRYWGVARRTYLVDPAGRVAHVFEKVNPLGHGKDVARTLERLRSGK